MLEYYWSKILKKIRGSALKNSCVHKTSKVESGTSFIHSSMEKHSFCGYNCDINHAIIGKFCSIANNVVIGGGMHPMSWVSTSPVFYEGRDSVKTKFSTHQRKPISTTVIGHDVWIGQNVIIKQGISIGTGSVIGMGSIVTKDVDPYTIVAGNPAKLIKKRFDDSLIKNLLQSKWWDMNEKELNNLSKHIKDPKLFLKKIQS